MSSSPMRPSGPKDRHHTRSEIGKPFGPFLSAVMRFGTASLAAGPIQPSASHSA